MTSWQLSASSNASAALTIVSKWTSKLISMLRKKTRNAADGNK